MSSQKLLIITSSKILLFTSVLYGFFISGIPDDGFIDYINYLDYAKYSGIKIGINIIDGPLVFLSNEPVWLLLNSLLGAYYEPEIVVRIIIFFSTTTVSLIFLTYYPKNTFLIILFLLFPQVVKNHLIHLRQGLAVAFFMMGWHSKIKTRHHFLLAITPFIHSSFFLILFIFYLNKLFCRFPILNRLRFFLVFLISLSITIYSSVLAGASNLRQSEHFDSISKVGSGFGFIFWLVIFFIFITDELKFKALHSFEIGVVIFYLASYWYTENFSRVFEDVLLLVLVSGLSLSKSRRVLFIAFFIFFFLATWLTRLNSPSFGYGLDSEKRDWKKVLNYN